MSVVTALALGAIALAQGACASEDVPVPPNMDELVAAYEAPTGRLDAGAVDELFGAAQPTLQTLAAFLGFQFVVGSIDSLERGLHDNGVSTELAIDIDGRVDVSIVCPGHGAPTDVVPERDGTLYLELPINDAALGPVAFGPAHECRFEHLPDAGFLPLGMLASRPGVIDGDVAVHLGKPLRLDGDPASVTPLVRLDGFADIEGLPRLEDPDFRLFPDRIETRVPVPGGEVIVFLARDAVGFREARGVWECSIDGSGRCSEGF